MINAQDIKNGTCIRMDGDLYFCIEFLHVKPGKGNTFMRTKLKNVVDGRVLERRFNIGEKLEDVRVERRPYQYLYMDGNDAMFMNNETFEQIPIDKNLITGADFMKEGDIVEVVSDASTETVLFAEMPIKTQLKITYTEPAPSRPAPPFACPCSSTPTRSSRWTPATAAIRAALGKSVPHNRTRQRGTSDNRMLPRCFLSSPVIKKSAIEAKCHKNVM